MSRRLMLFVILLILFTAPMVRAADRTSEEFHSEAIQAIDRWLQSVPKTQFKSAMTSDVFRWRVMLEKASTDSDKYKVYENLLSEIGDQQFEHEGYTYNESSLRYLMIAVFPGYFGSSLSRSASDGQGDALTPASFVQNSYSYYVSSVRSYHEQWDWLSQMLEYLYNYAWYRVKDYQSQIASSAYDIVQAILGQYLALSRHLLKTNRRIIENTGYFYSAYQVYSSEKEEDTVLRHISEFVKKWANWLEPQEKEAILNYIVPDHQNNDYAVKIYAVLADL